MFFFFTENGIYVTIIIVCNENNYVIVIFILFLIFSLGLKDIVIIVRSQHNAFHVRKAKALKQSLSEQAETMGEKV